MNTHTCFAAGCDAQVEAGYLMCWKHWRRVPKNIRTVIFATAGVPKDRSMYHDAVFDAMKVVATKEGRTETECLAHLHKVTVERYGEQS